MLIDKTTEIFDYDKQSFLDKGIKVQVTYTRGTWINTHTKQRSPYVAQGIIAVEVETGKVIAHDTHYACLLDQLCRKLPR
jgi:hypothetical protein